MWLRACSLTFRRTVALCRMLHFIISRNERVSLSCFTADYIIGIARECAAPEREMKNLSGSAQMGKL